MRLSLRVASILLVASWLAVPSAHAQTLEQEQASTTSTSGGADTLGGPRTVESGHQLSDDQATLEETEERPAQDDGISAVYDETNHDYFSFGFMARGVVIPDFMINAFVFYRGSNAVNAGMGGYFAWRRNGLNVMAEVWYLGFGQEGYFHGISAVDTETEFVRSQLGVVFGNFVFQWAVPVTPWFAIDIGLGIGLGGVVGNLYRQEATPVSGSQYGYGMCTGVGSGPGTSAGAYCEGPVERPGPGGRLDDSRSRGGTYQIQSMPNGTGGTGPNPFYFGDGGIPPMFAWLDLPRVTARFTPIRQLQIRVDLGYNIYGWSFGGSIGYQL